METSKTSACLPNNLMAICSNEMSRNDKLQSMHFNINASASKQRDAPSGWNFRKIMGTLPLACRPPSCAGLIMRRLVSPDDVIKDRPIIFAYQNGIVGSINFGTWACHLASEKFLSIAVSIQWGLPLLLCGMENCGLGFVCY